MRGHIHKRVHRTKSGKTTVLYYAVVERPRRDGKRRQDWGRGYTRRKDAEAALPERLQASESGIRAPPKNLDVRTFLLDVWLPTVEPTLKLSTADGYRRVVTLYVVPCLGHVRLASLTNAQLVAHYRWLAAEGGRGQQTGPAGSPDSRTPRCLAPSTLRKVQAVVRAALNWGVESGYLKASPAANIKRARADDCAGVRAWTERELQQFNRVHASHEFFDVFFLLERTGMRRGEVVALSWSDVDLEQARMSIRRSTVLVGGRPLTTGTKSGSPRVVDLDAETVEMLARRQERQRLARRLDPKILDSNLIFSDELGRQLSPDRLSDSFQRAVVATPDVNRITVHGLRHTHATILLKHGVPAKVVAERLGHADPAFTIRTYQAVLPGMQAGAAALFASVIRTGAAVD